MVLELDEEAFEVVFSGKIEGHGVMPQVGTGSGGGYHNPEVPVAEFAAIGGTEEPSAGFQTGYGFGNEVSVVALDTEDFSVFVAGKSRRVQDDAVESTLLFGETVKPVERVSLAEIMFVGFQSIKEKVLPGPVETGLGEIQRRRDGSAKGGIHGKCSRVGECVEDAHAVPVCLADTSPVVSLIEEDTLGIAGSHVDEESDALFDDVELERSGISGVGDGNGRLFIVLV